LHGNTASISEENDRIKFLTSINSQNVLNLREVKLQEPTNNNKYVNCVPLFRRSDEEFSANGDTGNTIYNQKPFNKDLTLLKVIKFNKYIGQIKDEKNKITKIPTTFDLRNNFYAFVKAQKVLVPKDINKPEGEKVVS
jgi:hypothetical protein